MSETRQNKISRLIQKELSDIFQKESRNLFRGCMISVTFVRMTPDYGMAKVYISIFPPEKREEIFKLVNEQNKSISHALNQRIRFQMRFMPELMFLIDDSLDYVEKIDNLLKK
ncbi:MAG: 30S ribosome-binding factor RbfA [Bacteroidota bacterium]|nr:30S ribosome-binding factor RbfA [Bacteroidota bacterium]